MRRLLRGVLVAVVVLGSGWLMMGESARADDPLDYGGSALFYPPYPSANGKFGVGLAASPASITDWDVDRLDAGWYVNWGTYLNPPHPNGMVYVQIARLQGPDRPPASCLRSCTAYQPTCTGIMDYSGCQEGHPADPAAVGVSPDRSVIQQIARANPGSLWAIGNEPDRPTFMDDVCPDEYAMLYHELYGLIKEADPTAKVTVAGIVQATPVRLQYLNIVRCVYLHQYGETLPVDLWNVHAFILNEEPGQWGCDVPAGMVTASLYQTRNVWDCDNMTLFKQQIHAFRQWMFDIGERDKPLIVTEYGILMPAMTGPYWLCDGDPYHDDPLGRCVPGNGRPYDYERVTAFMQATFDYFLGVDPAGIDADIGYLLDGNRLVQAWNWYSLNEDWMYNGNLFNNGDKQITGFGEDFEDTTQPLVTDYRDLLPWYLSFEHEALLLAGDPVTVTVSSRIFNMGTLGADNVPVRYTEGEPGIGGQIGSDQSVLTVPTRYADVSPTTAVTWTGIASGCHPIYVQVDPSSVFTESDKSNNVISATLDFRADLLIDSLVFTPPSASLGPGQVVTITIDAVVHNTGHLAAANIPVDFWDGDPGADGVQIDSQIIVPDPLDPLLPGGLVPVQALWTTDVAAKHMIFVRVDPEHTISDADTDDNQVSGEIWITGERVYLPIVLKRSSLGASEERSSVEASPGRFPMALPTMTPVP